VLLIPINVEDDLEMKIDEEKEKDAFEEENEYGFDDDDDDDEEEEEEENFFWIDVVNNFSWFEEEVEFDWKFNDDRVLVADIFNILLTDPNIEVTKRNWNDVLKLMEIISDLFST